MKYTILILGILINLFSAFAKELIIKDPLHYKGGFSGVIPLDLNENKSARIMVSIPYEKDVEIECSRKIGKVEKGIGIFSFWVVPPSFPNKQFFTIRTKNYEPLVVDIWTNEGRLLGGHVYELVISIPDQRQIDSLKKRIELLEEKISELAPSVSNVIEENVKSEYDVVWFVFPSTYDPQTGLTTWKRAKYRNKIKSNSRLLKIEFFDDKTRVYLTVTPNEEGSISIGKNTFLLTKKERLFFWKSKGDTRLAKLQIYKK